VDSGLVGSLIFGGPSPNFLRGGEQKFYSGGNRQFLLYFPNSQKPANGDQGNCWDICHMGGSH